MTEFIVTPLAMRPASSMEQCFYCHQPIGSPHKETCVLVQRKVKIRMVVEYAVDVPAGWTKEEIEFHRNDGTWCASNALDELAKLDSEDACLCHCARFEYIEDAGEHFLREA